MYRQIVILTALICFLAAPALAAQMSVEPAYQEAFQGDNITVNITVATEGDENVYAASYTLYFNNMLLHATSLEKGPFLSQDGNPSDLQIPPTGINNTAGEIKYGEYKIGAVPGVTGYGVLSTITFQVIGEEGISPLNLSDLNFALLYSAPPEYGPIPTTLNNGLVEVIGKLEFGDAPDPTYPSLLVSDGVRHIQTNTEYLGLNSTGDWKDFEHDANVIDLDLFDDGLLTSVLTADDPAQTVSFEVTNTISQNDLIVNILVDLNQNGIWDPGEHVVQNQAINLSGPAEGIFISNPFSTAGAVSGPTWMRVTLTRSPINPGWNGTMMSAGYGDPFGCGETEDWLIEVAPAGICGDANDDGTIDMTDVMIIWYDFADYPYPGAYTITNEWAADVNCDGTIDMTDVMTLWYDFADYPTPGAYEVNCCGG